MKNSSQNSNKKSSKEVEDIDKDLKNLIDNNEALKKSISKLFDEIDKKKN